MSITLISQHLQPHDRCEFSHCEGGYANRAFWTLELDDKVTVFIPGTPVEFAERLLKRARDAEAAMEAEETVDVPYTV